MRPAARAGLRLEVLPRRRRWYRERPASCRQRNLWARSPAGKRARNPRRSRGRGAFTRSRPRWTPSLAPARRRRPPGPSSDKEGLCQLSNSLRPPSGNRLEPQEGPRCRAASRPRAVTLSNNPRSEGELRRFPVCSRHESARRPTGRRSAEQPRIALQDGPPLPPPSRSPTNRDVAEPSATSKRLALEGTS